MMATSRGDDDPGDRRSWGSGELGGARSGQMRRQRPGLGSDADDAEIVGRSYHVVIQLARADGPLRVAELAERCGIDSIEVSKALKVLAGQQVAELSGAPGQETATIVLA
jgi:DNA-binding MarR family transcriptional regulator